MAAYLQNFEDDVFALVAAFWPEVKANGILTAEQAEITPREELKEPYAVVEFDTLDDADWGLTNEAYELNLTLYYVADTRGPAGALRERLEAARDGLRSVGFARGGQVLEVTRLAWGREAGANSLFIDKGASNRVGVLVARCVVGETA